MNTRYFQARRSIQTLTKTNPNSDRKLTPRSRGAMGGSEVRGPVKAGRSDPRTSTSRLRRNRGARGILLGGPRDGFMRAGLAQQVWSAMTLVGLLVADPQIMAVRLQNDVG